MATKKQENKQQISLSIVDVERKYAIDTAEIVGNNGDGVVSWGKENNLPLILGTAYEKSPSLAAAINQSCNYVCGDGVEIAEEAATWKEEINRRHQTMEELIAHIALDYYVYGNFAIQIIFNKIGLPVELYPLDITKCRLNGKRDKVLYAKKGWSKYSSKSDEYPRFGFADFNPENPTMILFYNGSGVRRFYNPAPWQSALDSVLCEAEASRYSLGSLTQGFAARYIIDLPDTANLTDEQKQTIEDGIRKKFCGYDAESNFMIYYSNDESKTLSVSKIEADDSPEKFEKIMAISKEAILTSLRISPLLLGIGMANTGFSSNEFSDSFRLYQKTVAEPTSKMLTKVINTIIGVPDGVKIKPFEIKFEKLG